MWGHRPHNAFPSSQGFLKSLLYQITEHFQIFLTASHPSLPRVSSCCWVSSFPPRGAANVDTRASKERFRVRLRSWAHTSKGYLPDSPPHLTICSTSQGFPPCWRAGLWAYTTCSQWQLSGRFRQYPISRAGDGVQGLEHARDAHYCSQSPRAIRAINPRTFWCH